MKKSQSITKKILKITAIGLIIPILIILYISYAIDYNQEEIKQLKKEISNHYPTNEITYVNEYGNYYIIKTKDQIIVLSKDYKEVVKEDTFKLKENSDKLNIIYKNNKLMYEKIIQKSKTLTYEYFDIITGKKIKSTALELR